MTYGAAADHVSRTKFAEMVGVTRHRISQYIKTGLPVEADNKIDPAKGQAWIADNVAAERQHQWAGDEIAASTTGQSLNDLRREREAVRLERDQLELDRARGILVERDGVRRFLVERAKLERDSWVGWASRASTTIASEIGVEIGAVFPVLEREIREQLRQLAETPLKEMQN